MNSLTDILNNAAADMISLDMLSMSMVPIVCIAFSARALMRLTAMAKGHAEGSIIPPIVILIFCGWVLFSIGG